MYMCVESAKPTKTASGLTGQNARSKAVANTTQRVWAVHRPASASERFTPTAADDSSK